MSRPLEAVPAISERTLAVSVHLPYALLIRDGHKRIENRTKALKKHTGNRWMALQVPKRQMKTERRLGQMLYGKSNYAHIVTKFGQKIIGLFSFILNSLNVD